MADTLEIELSGTSSLITGMNKSLTVNNERSFGSNSGLKSKNI